MGNNENNFQNEVKDVENEVKTAQEEKKTKKNGKGKKVLLFILLLAVFLLLGILVGVMIPGNNKPEFVKQIEDKITNQENKDSKKIDESKPWVYDAEYLKENKKIYQDSAKTEEDADNSEKDLVVPYININSDAAKRANEQIKALYDKYYDKYGKEASEHDSSVYKTYYHYLLKYDTYINDNILSVAITLYEGIVVVDGGTGGGKSTVYTYNFNLDTLNESGVDEMAKKCGFSSEDEVTSKIKSWEEKQRKILSETDLSDIFAGVESGKYLIDGNGKLNFLYRINTSGSTVYKEVIEKDKEIELFYTEEDANKSKNEASNNNKTVTETDKAYAEEYIKIIDKVKAEYPDANITCDLIYFNNDDIPDLVIGVTDYWVSLYMYENGTVYTLMENMAYGTGGCKYYEYLEKKGAIYSFGNSYAGAISNVVIEVLNSKKTFDALSIISEGATLEPTDSMYEEVQKQLAESSGYHYKGEKISEQEFNNKLKEYSVSSNEKDYKELYGSKSIEEIKKQLQ